MEKQPYASRMRQSAIKEIEASGARYLVFVNVPFSRLGRPDSDTSIVTWARSYIPEHYEVAGVADIVSGESTVYAWGEEAGQYAPRSPYVVDVFRRTAQEDPPGAAGAIARRTKRVTARRGRKRTTPAMRRFVSPGMTSVSPRINPS